MIKKVSTTDSDSGLFVKSDIACANYRGLAKVKVHDAFLLPQFEKIVKEKAPNLYIFLLP